MNPIIKTILTIFLTQIFFSGVAQNSKYKFQLGTGKVPAGFIQVGPASVFSETNGYGFDRGSAVKVVKRSDKKVAKKSFITSDKPFFFSGERS